LRPKPKQCGGSYSKRSTQGWSQAWRRAYACGFGPGLFARGRAAAVRGHWAIENRLHWQLDVTFQEDQCRLRQGHADANFSILRRAALALLKNESTAKVGIKNKRLIAGWNETYLEQVLLGT